MLRANVDGMETAYRQTGTDGPSRYPFVIGRMRYDSTIRI